MDREPGFSARLKLTLSYALFLMIAGVLLLAAVWLFLLRDVPLHMLVPELADFPRAFNTGNFGPAAFGPAAVIVMTFLLVLGLGGGWLLAGRMLAPLTRIADATRLAATGSLAHRIRLEGRGDEFRELADAFDTMLEQLEAHVAAQQRFAANASHELRTPLAITQTLLDVARTSPGGATAELLDQLRSVNHRAIDLTEALLLLSRADARSFPREPVDLSLVAEEATETLLPFAERYGVRVDVDGGAGYALGSRALLLQVTTNLVHNAIVHNLGPGGHVWVSTAQAPGEMVLTVENTGEPLGADLVAVLSEPFQRGAGRQRSDDGGVGLGLAIVRRVTEAHDGTLDLAPRAGGGLRATARFPTAPAPLERAGDLRSPP